MSIIKNYQPAKGICKVTFSYPLTEGVKTVQVLGDFNNWDTKLAPKMKKGKSELSVAVELAAGNEYAFKYLLDGAKWENEQNADKYTPSPFSGSHNSVIVIDRAATSKATAPKAKATTAKVAAPKAKATTAKVTAPKATVPAAKAKAATPKSTAPAAKATAPKAKVVSKTASKTVKAVAPKAAASKADKSVKTSAPKAEKVVKVTAPKTSAPKAPKADTAKTVKAGVAANKDAAKK